jgi:ABC-type Fe3+-siderophore transport system permease subunit
LRNPLATPFTLGVSTGAALGAVLAITFNLSSPSWESRRARRRRSPAR